MSRPRESDKAELRRQLHDLITANNILHFNDVVDAYGHISLRHPWRPDIFIMSGNRAPALVASQADLVPYNVSDASPVDINSQKGYSERFIHSEIYKRFPHINSIVHSHSEAVLPYTMSGVSMQPTFHIAGFLGTHVPNFDITPLYKDGDQQDMLVNSRHFGSSLADHFSAEGSAGQDHNVVLMTSHGFTTLGTSIKQAVYRSIYTHKNAGIQTNALLIRSASKSTSDISEMRYLSEDQVKGSQKMNDATQDRPWGLWVQEVKTSPLYKSEAPSILLDERFVL